MSTTHPDAYLSDLDRPTAQRLRDANEQSLARLRSYVGSGDAVAFLGAGASAPLYPLWNELVDHLLELASENGLGSAAASTCRARASSDPAAAVELVRESIGEQVYLSILRDLFKPRRHPETGRTWTPVQEMVCRCRFKGVITTNYDPGIVDARTHVRPADRTGFAVWHDEEHLGSWLNRDAFKGEGLPVLYAHGFHTSPRNIVLTVQDYRRAYRGRLARTLESLLTTEHFVWIGFSHADRQLTAILDQVNIQAATVARPIAEPRHVAILPWDPESGDDPATLEQFVMLSLGSSAVLYPALRGDHSALQRLLATLVPEPAVVAGSDVEVPGLKRKATTATTWVGVDQAPIVFAGRTAEIARIARWSSEISVRVVGITAWGGAGKTALVREWERHSGASVRPGCLGVFAWSFYANPSPDEWADHLLDWAAHLPGADARAFRRRGTLLERLATLIQSLNLVLILDGLEVLQGRHGQIDFGEFDGLLKDILRISLRPDSRSLLILTSRFPLADLERHDGTSARLLELGPLSIPESVELLTSRGATWLSEDELRAFATDLNGHALGLSVLAAVLSDPRFDRDLGNLSLTYLTATKTDHRVQRILEFYADVLSEQDRLLVAAVSLFTYEVPLRVLRLVGQHQSLRDLLGSLSDSDISAAIHSRLEGILTLRAGRVSAHPLIRDAFRPMAIGAAPRVAEINMSSVPGEVSSVPEVLLLADTVELLVQADLWEMADELFTARTRDGKVWLWIPAARAGQQVCSAFVADEERRAECGTRLGWRLGFYLNDLGGAALAAGDMDTAERFTHLAVENSRQRGSQWNLAIDLRVRFLVLSLRGRIQEARDCARESLGLAKSARPPRGTDMTLADNVSRAYGAFAGISSLLGQVRRADAMFELADSIQWSSPSSVRARPRRHLYSRNGYDWALHLFRTGRREPAWHLVRQGLEMSRGYGWAQDRARFQMLEAKFLLADGDPVRAEASARAAVRTCEEGELDADLAEALCELSSVVRDRGDSSELAFELAHEAVDLASQRTLVLAHIRALVARCEARLAMLREGVRESSGLLVVAEDDALAALRMARARGLAWDERESLELIAEIESLAGREGSARVELDALNERLFDFGGLDGDPLLKIEREVRMGRSGGYW